MMAEKIFEELKDFVSVARELDSLPKDFEEPLIDNLINRLDYSDGSKVFEFVSGLAADKEFWQIGSVSMRIVLRIANKCWGTSLGLETRMNILAHSSSFLVHTRPLDLWETVISLFVRAAEFEVANGTVEDGRAHWQAVLDLGAITLAAESLSVYCRRGFENFIFALPREYVKPFVLNVASRLPKTPEAVVRDSFYRIVLHYIDMVPADSIQIINDSIRKLPSAGYTCTHLVATSTSQRSSDEAISFLTSKWQVEHLRLNCIASYVEKTKSVPKELEGALRISKAVKLAHFVRILKYCTKEEAASMLVLWENIMKTKTQSTPQDICELLEVVGQLQFTVSEVRRVVEIAIDRIIDNSGVYKKLLEVFGLDAIVGNISLWVRVQKKVDDGITSVEWANRDSALEVMLSSKAEGDAGKGAFQKHFKDTLTKLAATDDSNYVRAMSINVLHAYDYEGKDWTGTRDWCDLLRIRLDAEKDHCVKLAILKVLHANWPKGKRQCKSLYMKWLEDEDPAVRKEAVAICGKMLSAEQKDVSDNRKAEIKNCLLKYLEDAEISQEVSSVLGMALPVETNVTLKILGEMKKQLEVEEKPDVDVDCY